MLAAIIFIVLLLLTFAVLFYFLRPSQVQTAVRQRLAGIADSRAYAGAGTTILKHESAPSPWLDDLVNRAPGAAGLSLLIRQSGKKVSSTYVIFGALGATIVAWWLAAFIFANALIVFAIGILVGVSPFIYLYILRDIRFNRCDTQLPEAIDLMARALRAGHSLAAVMEMLGQEIPEPLGAEFRILHEEQSLGLPTREAILHLVDRLPLDNLRFLATAILVQNETGGNLTQILDKTAVVMRERVRLRGQLRIYTAQGRVTGWILGAMPFIMFALISLVNPGYERILFTDPLGIRMVYIGMIMLVAGILVIRKIVDVKV